MISKWKWILTLISRKLWVRTYLFALVAVATALISIVMNTVIPDSMSISIDAEVINHILNILASSMLAVTTFSLNIMVSAYRAASSGATPRATRLLMEDSATQNALATFIGSFLFSLVGIIALSMGAYDHYGRILLFIVTLIVIALIVLTLLRWIQHLSLLGRVGETTARVEAATLNAIRKRKAHPWLGGQPWKTPQSPPEGSTAIYSEQIGYLQYIDMGKLASNAESQKCEIYVACQPGAFIHPSKPLAWVKDSSEELTSILDAFTIKEERSFDQDPRFGFSVLAEIASRALSPAVNDLGTAIDVIGRAVRLLREWGQPAEDPSGEVAYPRLYVPSITNDDLFDDIFTPIARDGAALIEVQMRLQKSLIALKLMSPENFSSPAETHAWQALKRARQSMLLDEDKECLFRVVNDAWFHAAESHGEI